MLFPVNYSLGRFVGTNEVIYALIFGFKCVSYIILVDLLLFII